MDVIPVLDVARSEVVRGVKGDRASYRPIISPLVAGSAPAAVARALFDMFPMTKLYIADLDGIEGRGRNVGLVADTADWSAGGSLEIWLDAGLSQPAEARKVLADPRVTLVVGSESLAGVEDWRALRAEAGARIVLSLDFRGADFIGPAELWSQAAHWPSRVIVMTLARVGSGEGPDVARVADVIRRAGGNREVYAAGGVRDREDLWALHALGAAGVLVASALHSGAVTPRDVVDVMAASKPAASDTSL